MSYRHLSKIRVLDLGIITAGASTSAILADLGADVIKVEGPTYIDPFRIWSGRESREEWWNQSPFFAFTNRNKRGLCLDLKSAEGRSAFLDLVRISDVLVENFRAKALDRLGLGFDVLAEINPRLILASVSSQGTTGPDAATVSFGSTLEGSSGLASLIHYADGIPNISGHALNYPDQVVSLFAAGAVLCALVDREETGRGAHLDISQRELAAFMLGEALLGGHPSSEYRGGPGAPASMNAIVGTSDNRWLAVTLQSAALLADVARRLGWPEALSPEALSRAIETRPAEEAVAAIRAAGGCVEFARAAKDLLDSGPDIEASLAFAKDPEGRPVKGLPWRSGSHRATIDRSAPSLGRDNHEVAKELLGMSDERYGRLVKSGDFSTEPRVDTK